MTTSVTASLALLLKQAGSTVACRRRRRTRRWRAPRSGAVQLVIQDMNFTRRTSGEEGLALLREIRSRCRRCR